MSDDSKTRFSDRVGNYVRYRPGYPDELFGYLESELRLEPHGTIADIGSGTGLSSLGFLKRCHRVIGVEPNKPMRMAAKSVLGSYELFESVDGSADATGLESRSVDAVFAGQSFHWFCNEESAHEFLRILRPGGFVLLAWNERLLNINRFHIEFEEILKRFGTDYEEIRHDKFYLNEIKDVFKTDFRVTEFNNKQTFDFKGLMGRVLSSSYMPSENSPMFDEMRENLESVFAVNQEKDRISVLYKTKLFFCKF